MDTQMIDFWPFFSEIQIAIDRDNEIQLERLDQFNVFQVLKLETNEARTHSGFIGELLNPKGSHMMKDIFLKAFLETINREEKFNLEETTVHLEEYIGPVSIEKLRGGRVDIIIRNSIQSLCIENKIYAGLQSEQLKRYINYNQPNNYVIYLTLDKDELYLGEEYDGRWENITYKHEILQWLGKCLILANNYPSLRECIRQYIQLIEKLTGMLINQEMNENVARAIFDNAKAAKVIADNYVRVTDELKVSFQQQVFDVLRQRNKTDWKVEMGAKANQINAQIWIKPPGRNQSLWFGIETFSGRGYFAGKFLQGIISIKQSQDIAAFESIFKIKRRVGSWYDHEFLIDQFGTPINFADPDFLARIFKESDYRDNLADHICTSFLKYFEDRESVISTLLSAGQAI